MAGKLGYLHIELALDTLKFEKNIELSLKKAKQFSTETSRYLNNIDTAMFTFLFE